MKDHANGCKELILISRINQQNIHFFIFRKCFLKEKTRHLYASTCIPYLCKPQECVNLPQHLIDIIHSSEGVIQNHIYVKVEEHRLEG